MEIFFLVWLNLRPSGDKDATDFCARDGYTEPIPKGGVQ